LKEQNQTGQPAQAANNLTYPKVVSSVYYIIPEELAIDQQGRSNFRASQQPAGQLLKIKKQIKTGGTGHRFSGKGS